MNVIKAIEQRRSIRHFQEMPISDEIIRKILDAAIRAPSGKNRQPWSFIVVQQDRRPEMIRILRAAVARVKQQGESTGSCEWTTNSMAQAPITVFVFNPYVVNGEDMDDVFNLVDVQSVGAAIQNMLLAAQELGIGSLWICDVFYAYHELCAWLGETHQMIAAVSLGYPDEKPPARPRKPLDEVTRWL